MSERKCLITGKQCMCNCENGKPCFIEVQSDAIVRKMAQTASDASLDAANKPELDNLTTEWKLKVADILNKRAKKKIGKINSHI